MNPFLAALVQERQARQEAQERADRLEALADALLGTLVDEGMARRDAEWEREAADQQTRAVMGDLLAMARRLGLGDDALPWRVLRQRLETRLVREEPLIAALVRIQRYDPAVGCAPGNECPHCIARQALATDD